MKAAHAEYTMSAVSEQRPTRLAALVLPAAVLVLVRADVVQVVAAPRPDPPGRHAVSGGADECRQGKARAKKRSRRKGAGKKNAARAGSQLMER